MKSLHRVSIKWDISKPVSSASVKSQVCSLKVLQRFACSTMSSWFLFLHICLIFSPCSSFCLRVTRSGSVLLIIYSGCAKKTPLWWVQILSSLGFLLASSAFCAVGLELQRELPSLQGWGVPAQCSDPRRAALALLGAAVHIKTSLLMESLVLCFSECNYNLRAFNILAPLLLSFAL